MYTQLNNGNFGTPRTNTSTNQNSASAAYASGVGIGYGIGSALGTTIPNSPINSSLTGIADLLNTITNDSFILNAGGVIVGAALTLISIKSMID